MGGIIGIYGHKNAAELTQVGLFCVQHRGQESCGIAAFSQKTQNFSTHRSPGLVMNGLPPEIMEKLPGESAIGHVRYPTSGIKFGLHDAQPFVFKTALREVAIALSGNIINAESLIKKIHKKGGLFQHSSETELIIHLLAQKTGPIKEKLRKVLPIIEGGFVAVMLSQNKLFAFRDPYGIRNLVLGKLKKTYIIASESSAIEVMGGKVLRDIRPAEILTIENGTLSSSFYAKPKKTYNCIFEQVYLSRPDSIIRGQSVAKSRMQMGQLLAKQMKDIKADIVMPVPDSGIFAAMGFAKASKLPFEMGLVRNHYMGRSFLKTMQHTREMIVRLKLLPICDIVKGKDIVLVDDSLVRGTTAKKLIRILRKHGAKKVHLALTSLPIIAPCYYGINTRSEKELISYTHTHTQMVEALDADSVTFISMENATHACSGKNSTNGFCSCCFTGKYLHKISKKTQRCV